MAGSPKSEILASAPVAQTVILRNSPKRTRLESFMRIFLMTVTAKSRSIRFGGEKNFHLDRIRFFLLRKSPYPHPYRYPYPHSSPFAYPYTLTPTLTPPLPYPYPYPIFLNLSKRGHPENRLTQLIADRLANVDVHVTAHVQQIHSMSVHFFIAQLQQRQILILRKSIPVKT